MISDPAVYRLLMPPALVVKHLCSGTVVQCPVCLSRRLIAATSLPQPGCWQQGCGTSQSLSAAGARARHRAGSINAVIPGGSM